MSLNVNSEILYALSFDMSVQWSVVKIVPANNNLLRIAVSFLFMFLSFFFVNLCMLRFRFPKKLI